MRTGFLALSLLALGCGTSTAPATSDAAADTGVMDTGGAVESAVDAPKATEPAVVVWGGSTFGGTCKNPRLLENVLGALGHRKPGLKIFYPTWDGCDPRKDPKFCALAPSLDALKPVLDVYDRLGTVDFGKMVTDLSAFDVVVANFCNSDLALQHPSLEKFVADGRGLLVVGSNACLPGDDATTSAELANAFLAKFAVQFSPIDSKVTGCEPIPASAQVGLLAGVDSLDGQRLPTLVVKAPALPLFPDSGGNPRLAVYPRALP